MMTLSKAIAILKKAKIRQAELEVWDLLAAAVKKNKSELILTYRPADNIKSKKFAGYIKKRASGAPFAYVVGSQPFLGHNFLVTKDTLIPRPATEDLVLAVEKYLHNIKSSVKIFDIGTGSGCIAISLALRNKNKLHSLTATDISAAALKIARKNLSANFRQRRTGAPASLRLELADKKTECSTATTNPISNSRELEIKRKVNITFKKTDLLKNISLPKNCLLIANLPYVRPVRNQSRKIISNGEPKSAIFCAYKNGLPVTYLELLKQLQQQKNLPRAVFLEMPRACSTRYKKMWCSALPHTPLFIIRI